MLPDTARRPFPCPRFAGLWLVLLCIALYLPGLWHMPVTDRDEARFVQASKQMLESGDYIDIRFQDTARHKKPVGIYWLQSLSAGAAQRFFHTADNHITPYRIPSFLAGIAAVLAFFALASRVTGRNTAFLGSLLLAPCLLLVTEAHIAKTDATLFATIVLQQGALLGLYAAFRQQQKAAWWLYPLFWGAMGLGILVKGPVNPLLALTTIAALRFAGREKGLIPFLKPLPWLLLPALLITPWLWMIQEKTDGAFLREALGKDFFGKVKEGQESHGAPPGYYLLLSPLLLWPSSLLLLLALPHWRTVRATIAGRFALAWLLPFWLLLELTPTKLPHYLLPLAPALCLLAALVLQQQPLPKPKGIVAVVWKYWVRFAWGTGCLFLAIALPGLPLFQENLFLPLAIAGTAAIVVLLLMRHEQRRPPVSFLVGTALAAAVVYATAFTVTLPSLSSVFASERICREARGNPVASAGYSEPSLIFRCGTGTLLATPQSAWEFLYRNPDGMVVVTTEEREAFEKLKNASPQLSIRQVAQWTGFNYNEGERTTFTLYRRQQNR